MVAIEKRCEYCRRQKKASSRFCGSHKSPRGCKRFKHPPLTDAELATAVAAGVTPRQLSNRAQPKPRVGVPRDPIFLPNFKNRKNRRGGQDESARRRAGGGPLAVSRPRMARVGGVPYPRLPTPIVPFLEAVTKPGAPS